MLTGSISFWFAVLYRFAPNLRDCEWRWSTPGAFCAVVLWIGSTFATRLYFEHVNNYSRSYGHLNGVVILLLWLYVSNGAILIGGEMNSEIEKHIAEGDAPEIRCASGSLGIAEVEPGMASVAVSSEPKSSDRPPHACDSESISRLKLTAVDRGFFLFQASSDVAGGPAQRGIRAKREHHGGAVKLRPQDSHPPGLGAG